MKMNKVCNNRKSPRKHICFWLTSLVLFCILTVSLQVEAATPRLMVTDYSVKGGSVVGGKEFDLKLVLTNTAAKSTVKNIKVTIATANGEMLPVDGAGTAYIESMAANTEQELKFKMKAVKGLEEKSYKMTIKLEYESTSGMEYTVEDSIFLPVTMEQRLTVTDLYVGDSDVHIGDSVEVTARINNLGEGSLYNVSAKIHGDGIDEMKSYIGNIEPGKSGTMDVITTAAEVTYDHSKCYLTIIYEDIDGNEHEEESEFKTIVTAPLYDQLELVKGEKETKKDWTVMKWAVAVIVVVASVSVVLVRKAKRKKKILEEF